MQVGPSLPKEAPSRRKEIIKMVVKVKRFAFVFEDEKLAEYPLDLILLLRDH